MLVAASGSIPVSCALGEDLCLLWVGLFLSCSGAVVDQMVCLQHWPGEMNVRLLIALMGFEGALPPSALGCLKYLKIPSLLG